MVMRGDYGCVAPRAIGLVLGLFLHIGLAGAEIYRWTDDDGNVHFGDRPLDEASASRAKAVEIDEAYKPPQRSEQEIRAIVGEQRARATADKRRRESMEKRLAEEKAAKAKRKAERCAALKADIDTFGTAKMVNGVLTVHYLYDEETGKSISAADQRKIVAELKAERDALGC